MKNRTPTADIRIKRFMDKKLREFPELEDVNQPRAVRQRGYSWSELFGVMQMKKG